MSTRIPPWVPIAQRHLGLREIPGAPTAPTISRWLQTLNAWWRDDETPWCGVAMAAWMRECNVRPPKAWYRARAWADWGLSGREMVYGSVVVFERRGGGHVGITIAKHPDGRLWVLGGNQNDSVSNALFPTKTLIAVRWPVEYDGLYATAARLSVVHGGEMAQGEMPKMV